MADKVVPITGRRTPAKKAPAKKAPARKAPAKAAPGTTVKAPRDRHPAGKSLDRGSEIRERRLKGMTYAAIAADLNLASAGAAALAEQRYLDKIAVQLEEEDASAHRALEVARLDQLQSEHFDAARSDVAEALLVLRIIDQRSKLLGLYQPDLGTGNTFNTVIVTGDADDYVGTLRQMVERRERPALPAGEDHSE